MPFRSTTLRAAGLSEALEVVRPVADVSGSWLAVRAPRKLKRQRDQRMQQIVEFMLVAQVGPDFAADRVDRGLIEAACAIGDAVGQRRGAG